MKWGWTDAKSLADYVSLHNMYDHILCLWAIGCPNSHKSSNNRSNQSAHAPTELSIYFGWKYVCWANRKSFITLLPVFSNFLTFLEDHCYCSLITATWSTRFVHLPQFALTSLARRNKDTDAGSIRNVCGNLTKTSINSHTSGYF